MKTFTLYGLNKPGEEARYIGVTSKRLEVRLSHHLCDRPDNHRTRWIRKMLQENQKPEIVPYCVGLTDKEACELERSMIAELKKLGLSLVNGTGGGEGIFEPTDETRKKLSEGNKKWKRSPETCGRISESKKGNKNLLGFKFSPESKKKMSLAQTGEKSHMFGKKRSVEDRKKVSDGLKLYYEKKRQEEILEEMWS